MVVGDRIYSSYKEKYILNKVYSLKRESRRLYILFLNLKIFSLFLRKNIYNFLKEILS